MKMKLKVQMISAMKNPRKKLYSTYFTMFAVTSRNPFPTVGLNIRSYNNRVSHQLHITYTCQPVVKPEFGTLKFARPETKGNSSESASIGDCDSGDKIGLTALIQILRRRPRL
jgi:hypothetical protein